MKSAPRTRLAFWLFAITTVLTFLMIALGASVTTIEAADSDPEWSLFNFSYWFQEAAGGRWYELRHRAFGTLIGALTIVAWICVLVFDNRPRVKRFATWTVPLVIVQGLLGGLRIHVVSNQGLKDMLMSWTGLDHSGLRMVVAIVHGFAGQLFLAVLAMTCAMLSQRWVRGDNAIEETRDTIKVRKVVATTFVLLFVMLLLGAYVRHGRVFWPNASAPGRSAVLGIHMALAFAVLFHVFFARLRVGKVESHRGISRPVAVAQFLVLLQILLGFVAWATTRGDVEAAAPGSWPMILRTAHVANGALLLALFAYSWIWCREWIGAKDEASS
ncbi:MAG: COX15/CtaA family protein [Planctomycetes bacterium]|nr:COX15/CtaA family protein [Planctomycetota bacterium]